MPKSTDSPSDRKPVKPSGDYPLTPRKDGRWMKKIDGKLRYFTGDADEALKQYEAFILKLGDQYHGKPQIRHLCDAFLCSKEVDRDAGQISQRTFDEYHKACDVVVLHFGKLKVLEKLTREDADTLRARLCKGVGPKTQAGRITRTRSIFLFGFDRELVPKPFHKWIKTVPSRVLKTDKSKRPAKTCTAKELRKLINEAPCPMDAMLLLAINCGFGNSDCADLELSWLDLDNGWHTFPRPKTGEPRKGKLWPETVKAIREAIENRPEPKDAAHENRVFLTRTGAPWVSPDRSHNTLSQMFRKLAKKAGIEREGLSFYSLRHMTETVGGDAQDQVAVNLIMGHVDSSMAANYRHGIDDSRLEAIADHIRQWLYAGTDGGGDDRKSDDDRPQLRVVG